MTKGPASAPVEVLVRVTALLTEDHTREAEQLLRDQYPVAAAPERRRAYSRQEMLEVFVRDGFTDRYTGDQLVHPGALRLISLRLPSAFPFHPNGKYGVGHPAYWDLFPTIDHVVPVARGGEDVESNWVTTSMLTNARKANWLLEELKWEQLPVPAPSAWDGLSRWFLDHAEPHLEAVAADDPATRASLTYVKEWYRVTRAVLGSG